MWSVEFKSHPIILSIKIGSEHQVSAVQIWNYNASLDLTSCGVGFTCGFDSTWYLYTSFKNTVLLFLYHGVTGTRSTIPNQEQGKEWNFNCSTSSRQFALQFWTDITTWQGRPKWSSSTIFPCLYVCDEFFTWLCLSWKVLLLVISISNCIFMIFCFKSNNTK